MQTYNVEYLHWDKFSMLNVDDSRVRLKNQLVVMYIRVTYVTYSIFVYRFVSTRHRVLTYLAKNIQIQ